MLVVSADYDLNFYHLCFSISVKYRPFACEYIQNAFVLI
jgi:hypothetical protein